MKLLKENDLSLIKGGGYWWKGPDGRWYYIPDDEPEE